MYPGRKYHRMIFCIIPIANQEKLTKTTFNNLFNFKENFNSCIKTDLYRLLREKNLKLILDK